MLCVGHVRTSAITRPRGPTEYESLVYPGATIALYTYTEYAEEVRLTKIFSVILLTIQVPAFP